MQEREYVLMLNCDLVLFHFAIDHDMIDRTRLTIGTVKGSIKPFRILVCNMRCYSKCNLAHQVDERNLSLFSPLMAWFDLLFSRTVVITIYLS